jgi:NAD-dependent histone deacetylase SIR2
VLLQESGLQLPRPECLFDIGFFSNNPEPFYQFAHRIFPNSQNYQPTPTHHFLRLLEQKKKLQRVYSQNVDTLEAAAGLQSVICCHGSFATATCLTCQKQFPSEHIAAAVAAREVARCVEGGTKQQSGDRSSTRVLGAQRGKCFCLNTNSLVEQPAQQPRVEQQESTDGCCGGILKPDITFFGEKLALPITSALEADWAKVDLLLVIGSSLKVPLDLHKHARAHKLTQMNHQLRRELSGVSCSFL